MIHLILALIVTLFIAMAAAFAKPPDDLRVHIARQQLVHDQQCNVDTLGLRNVECLIFYEQATDVAWIVLFDRKVEITHILRVDRQGKEELLYARDAT